MLTTQPYTPYLSEQDIRLFLREAPIFKQRMKTLYLTGLIVLAAGIAGYGVLNYDALLRVYTPTQSQAATPIIPIKPVVAATDTHVIPVPTPLPAPSIPENTLSTPSVNISSPITWDVDFDEKTVQSNLTNGVVHFKGTAKPGQKGFVVITGHSSNFPWIKGQYNTIFAPLHKVQAGESILINYQNKEYTYKITRVYQVKPSDLNVLQAGNNSGIRLITCTPIGTSLRRLIVEAEQITPNPAANTNFAHSTFTGNVPSVR